MKETDICDYLLRFASRDSHATEISTIARLLPLTQKAVSQFPAKGTRSEYIKKEMGVHSSINKEWTSGNDTWTSLVDKGLGNFLQVFVKTDPLRGRQVSCDCCRFQTDKTCVESKRFGLICHGIYPRKDEVLLTDQNDSDLGEIHTRLLEKYNKMYSTSADMSSFGGMNRWAMESEAPPTNPFLSSNTHQEMNPPRADVKPPNLLRSAISPPKSSIPFQVQTDHLRLQQQRILQNRIISSQQQMATPLQWSHYSLPSNNVLNVFHRTNPLHNYQQATFPNPFQNLCQENVVSQNYHGNIISNPFDTLTQEDNSSNNN